MFVCLTSARFNMYATVLSQGDWIPDDPLDPTSPIGHWENRQDPDTGEIIRVWVEEGEDIDPDTPGVQSRKIPCIVRGIVDGGIRVAGTTERYTPGGQYESADWAKMSYPSNITLSKRDRITNVTDRRGRVIWKEEEFSSAPTVWNVNGVTPIVDPFGIHIENMALLERAEVQQ